MTTSRFDQLIAQQTHRNSGRPRVSSPDDGLARCHEEAAQVLSYAVPGARVSIRRPHLRAWNQKNTEADRVYEIRVERGDRSVVRMGAYSLPALAAQLANDARSAIAEGAPA